MKKRISKIVYILLIILLLLIFLICSWKLYEYFSEGIKTQSAYNELSQLVDQARPTEDPNMPTMDWSAVETLPEEALATDPDSPYISVVDPNTGEAVLMLPEFEEPYGINSDIVGWLHIPDTNIDYPVVQRKDKTDYYIYRDFYGRQVMRGCLYVREQCDVFRPSDNVVIYGHMMQDGTMFADLANYTSKKYWQDHQYIQFDTLRGRHTYQVICVFKTTATAGKGFPYHLFVDGEYDSDLDEFWVKCRENAFYDTGLEPRYGDKLLTLSTCEYTLTNGRLVVVAKRIS